MNKALLIPRCRRNLSFHFRPVNRSDTYRMNPQVAEAIIAAGLDAGATFVDLFEEETVHGAAAAMRFTPVASIFFSPPANTSQRMVTIPVLAFLDDCRFATTV